MGWHVSSERFFSFSITTLFFKKDMQHQSTIYIYMYFFRCFISFHLITIHSFLFSQGKKNIDIDLDLFCSYCVIIYPLRNKIFIAYFVISDTIVVIYIYGGDQSGRKTQLFKYHVASVIHQRIMIF